MDAIKLLQNRTFIWKLRKYSTSSSGVPWPFNGCKCYWETLRPMEGKTNSLYLSFARCRCLPRSSSTCLWQPGCIYGLSLWFPLCWGNCGFPSLSPHPRRKTNHATHEQAQRKMQISQDSFRIPHKNSGALHLETYTRARRHTRALSLSNPRVIHQTWLSFLQTKSSWGLYGIKLICQQLKGTLQYYFVQLSFLNFPSAQTPFSRSTCKTGHFHFKQYPQTHTKSFPFICSMNLMVFIASPDL